MAARASLLSHELSIVSACVCVCSLPSCVPIFDPVHVACTCPSGLPPATDGACSSGNNSKTFKPKKNIPEGTNQYALKKYAEATLGSGNLRLAVLLPKGEDLDEWLAVISTSCPLSLAPPTCAVCSPRSGGLLQPDQYALRHHHGVLHRARVSSHVCRPKVRPRLALSRALRPANGRYEYLWADGNTVKKPIKCSAPGAPARAHTSAHPRRIHRLPHDLGAVPAR